MVGDFGSTEIGDIMFEWLVDVEIENFCNIFFGFIFKWWQGGETIKDYEV